MEHRDVGPHCKADAVREHRNGSELAAFHQADMPVQIRLCPLTWNRYSLGSNAWALGMTAKGRVGPSVTYSTRVRPRALGADDVDLYSRDITSEREPTLVADALM